MQTENLPEKPKHWSTNPRVTDGSRWLRKKDGQWYVYRQVGTYWESRQNPVAAYILLCEETGEKSEVDKQLMIDAVLKKVFVEIGNWSKEQILKNLI